MDKIMLVWGVIAIAHVVKGGLAPFQITQDRFRTSRLVRTGMVHIALYLHVGVLESVISRMTVSPPRDIALVLLPMWCFTYLFLMFDYEYSGGEFRWFNGLRKRRIRIDDVRGITILKGSQFIRIRFIQLDRTTTIRAGFIQVEDLVRRMASKEGIPVSNSELP